MTYYIFIIFWIVLKKIESYTSEGEQVFFETELIQDVVLRNLEIIGEATKNLSQSLRDEYDDVPWRKMACMRDKVIHDYLGVDLDIIWDTVEKELPKL